MDLLTDLPGFAIFAIIGTIFLGLSLVGLLLVRRAAPLALLREHNDVAGFIFAGLAVVYAVVLAFVAVAVWEDFEDSRTAVDDEAAANVELHRAMESFSLGHRQDVREAQLTYLNSVVDDEWPAMRAGDPSGMTAATLDTLWEQVRAIEPEGPNQEVWYGAVVDRIGELSRARDIRLAEAVHKLPTAMAVLLLLGAAITIGYTYLYGVRNFWSLALLTLALAGTIALVVSLIIILDSPFSGDTSVSPAALVRALETIAEPR
jgi:hypothetical protein